MNEEKLRNLAKRRLDQSTDQLDEKILSRLKTARREAVAKASASHPLSGWLMPMGGLIATAATVALVVSLWVVNPQQVDVLPVLDDMSLLSGSEDLEFFEELEFYQWLEDEKHVG